MSVSSLHWRENRVREEIYKQDLKQIDTSAHETGLPKSNGATFAPRGAKTRSPASREQKEKSPVTLDHLVSSHPCGRRRNVVLDLFESVRIDR